MTRAYEDLETLIRHSFKDKTLIAKALTHSSLDAKNNYQRLEFLGDRVLGLVVAEHLYQSFPGEAEGALARRLAALVQGSLLAEIAGEIGLGDYILLSDAEDAAGGRANENILADTIEALLGALYLEAGLEPCRAFIQKHWADKFDKMAAPPQHPKTAVQEWAQAKGLPLPEYEIVEQTGPDHAPEFVLRLTVEGFPPADASGKSRQDAEKSAAREFMRRHKI